jgi:hypothetical protein
MPFLAIWKAILKKLKQSASPSRLLSTRSRCASDPRHPATQVTFIFVTVRTARGTSVLMNFAHAR